MDRLNNIASYFNEKERKRLDNIAKNSASGLPEMTFEEIRLSCLENNGYETPELNDKIYLHFRGFRKIENLDKFTGCKAIWLESNGFSKLENLEPLLDLRCLYLAKNLISKMEGLDSLKNLTILDLSNNRISMIENLSCCPILQTLNIAHNALTNVASIEHLKDCALLNNVDITNNRLEADEAMLETFSAIPSLVALSVNGNDVTKLASFRKRMIASMSHLGYLDRPIDFQESSCGSRSLTTEFTPKEQETRQAEVEAASAAKKVASRFWGQPGRGRPAGNRGGGARGRTRRIDGEALSS